VTHHYFTFDSFLGFVVWTLCGWVFCYVLLIYYEGARPQVEDKNALLQREIRRAMAKCSLVWGLIIGFIWFMQHSSVT